MDVDASPVWQNAFLVGVLVLMVWCIWNGWRIGLVRALVSMVGILAGCGVGFAAGILIGAIAGTLSPTIGFVLGMVAGVAVGLVVYGGICFLGALLFKRTGQQRTMPLRLIYGVGGALVGVFVAISVLWGTLLATRGFGGMCEGSVDTRIADRRMLLPEPMVRTLVKLKHSVEAGSTGRFLESVDVVPIRTYHNLEKLGRVLSNPAALRRFSTYPGFNAIFSDIRIADLTSNPEVQDAVRSGREMSLLTNPKFLEAAKDPALIAKLQKIDIEKALDYALGAPPANHSPHP